ncbi:MAG: ATP-binding cassette domain-containing protein [Rhodobacter sp.]|nr:ATP-binding cassette domain-containing protein [Rhodobacter sp.]
MANQASQILEISNLCYTQPNGTVVFENFSVTIPTGRFVTLRGRSGVGKSTLLGLLAGHFLPDRGQLRVAGQPVRNASADRSMVFQQHNLFPWLNTLNNVEFGLKCLGLPKTERRERALKLLADMGVSDAAELFPNELSGGMQQRVGIARALAVQPSCLLMDEPLSALDADTRGRTLDTLSAVIRDMQVLVIMATHHQEALKNLADADLLILGPSQNECTMLHPSANPVREFTGTTHAAHSNSTKGL